MQTLKVIGLGGIAEYLLPPLLRYLTYSDYSDTVVTLVDGDSFEPKNLSRQSFRHIGNKAEVRATELREVFPQLTIKYIGEYVGDANVNMVINEGDVVLLCVDNHSTRRLVGARCEALDNICLITGGNEYTDGNVIVFVKKDGNALKPTITRYHPEIAEAEGDHPHDIGCDIQVVSSPQLVPMNNLISGLMLSTLYVYLVDCLNYCEIQIDMKRGSARALRLPL
ncbi:hypothetical protein COT97_01160 [Candidatus Falkowbacteria bacterium CG10_big_fil_rev_8_21_14_0_10_39_11]|uniref:THIF-type NAD/FAD binding fold domain-containing protein n=1 Tax=Candidatus Falkowbacteria bacterium CG10_big_fil_rev_8_21_14_0_10_39_11 TaxID=1974565 RepID=A0A2H0V5R5_9BACT|nr:MAG: hypothetical protein COT97_01160 [Candidatus Falkowbacteria bacterium CG10_big_fil_rev_8_21_14_0_10_39_11]